jgi:hypothetical protein
MANVPITVKQIAPNSARRGHLWQSSGSEMEWPLHHFAANVTSLRQNITAGVGNGVPMVELPESSTVTADKQNGSEGRPDAADVRRSELHGASVSRAARYRRADPAWRSRRGT